MHRTTIATLVLSVVAPVAAQSSVVADATAAAADRYARSAGGHAMWIHGERYVFADGGQFVENANGTARLTGILRSTRRSGWQFAANVALTGRTTKRPSGSPKLELEPKAYAPRGPVDPRRWRYYARTDLTLIGLADFEGAFVRGWRAGPAFQVGSGASGKNIRNGASGWFGARVLRQPRRGRLSINCGDLNINLGGDDGQCATEYARDGHGFWLQGLGSSRFVFTAPGRFVERADGTALLTGTIVDRANHGYRFTAKVELTGRVSPGARSYPPTGSPKRELPAGAYTSGGGTVDPGSWHYYTGLRGVLSGLGDLTGAQLSLTRMGPAFQVGFGASGKRVEYGASGWLTVRVTKQPAGKRIQVARGDINLGLRGECRPTPLCLKGDASPRSLSTMTTRCFTIEGCALATVTAVRFGSVEIDSQDPRDWQSGYFRILSDTKICVFPPMCLAPGCHAIRVVNAGGASRQAARACLTRPEQPTLRTAACVRAGERQNVLIHPGRRATKWRPFLIISGSNRPSVIPGLIELGIGNAWTDIAFCTMSRRDGACAVYGPYTIPPHVDGARLFFQAAILDDPIQVTRPIPVTNVAATAYKAAR